jgi:hypothetical protein
MWPATCVVEPIRQIFHAANVLSQWTLATSLVNKHYKWFGNYEEIVGRNFCVLGIGVISEVSPIFHWGWYSARNFERHKERKVVHFCRTAVYLVPQIMWHIRLLKGFRYCNDSRPPVGIRTGYISMQITYFAWIVWLPNKTPIKAVNTYCFPILRKLYKSLWQSRISITGWLHQ